MAADVLTFDQLNEIIAMPPSQVMDAAANLAKSGNPGTAVTILKQAYDRHPTRIDLLIYAGRLQYRRGLLAEAGHIFRTALIQKPGDVKAQNGLALALRDSGEPRCIAEAERLFRMTLKTKPDSIVARNGLAMLLLDSGEARSIAAAERLFRKTLQHNPDDDVARTGLAMLLSAHGEPARPAPMRIDISRPEGPRSG